MAFQGWNTFSNLGTGGGGGLANLVPAAQNRTQAGDAALGESFAKSAVSSAQSGVDAVLAGKSKIDANLNNLKSSAAAATQSANGMSADIAGVREQAGKVGGMADALLPYADKIGGLGDKLFTEGNGLYEQAMDVFGQGGALVRMDPSAGGLASQFINYFNSLSPDRLVSQAASDAQNAVQNSTEQAQRDLARRGVSASSGAYGALRQQAATALATALASAKQKAREMGLNLQSSQLDKMVAAATQLYGMGNQTAQNALSAQNAGVDANNAAANVVKGAGDLYGTSGNLLGTAGNLGATQANAHVSAGKLYGDAAQIENQYLNTLNAAYGHLSSAQSSAAGFITNLMGTLSKAGGGTGGVNVIDNTKAAQAARLASGQPALATFK